MKQCTECDNKHYAKGMCRSHYYKARHPALYASKGEQIRGRRIRQYAAHRDITLQRNAEWRQRNPDKMQQYRDRWTTANPDKVLQHSRKSARLHQLKNPDQYRRRNAQRYAAKRQAIPAWADASRIAYVYQRAVELGLEVDHVVPLRSPLVCGLHVWENLQLLERRINCSKGNRRWPDMPGEEAMCELQ